MTVNHLVPGSIPGAGATKSQIPYLSSLLESQPQLIKLIATFLQHSDEVENYFITNIKYLQKIKDNYYLVLRLGAKVYKKALRTSNLKKANIRKLKILKHFKDNYNMSFEAPNKHLKVITIIEEDDDVEEAQKIINDINKTAREGEASSKKINQLTTKTEEEIKYSTLEEEVTNFYKDYKKTKQNAEARIKEFESTFKYLYLKFPPQTRLLHLLEYEDWDNFRDFLIELPNNALRRYGTKKHGTDVQSIIDNIVIEFEQEDKEISLLTNRTINKHFNIFSMFLDFLVKTKKIKSNPITEMTELIEVPNPYSNFSDEHIIKLFKIKDEEVKNFFKVALYTGLRLSAIIAIKPEHINLETNKLEVPKDKTTNGVRTITIHKQLKSIFKRFIEDEREHLFFYTDNKDKVQKMINPLIFETLGEKRTIHGFRKNFVQQLFKVTDDVNLRKYIVGHSQKNDLTFTIYNLENMDFEKMEKVINQVSYRLKEDYGINKLNNNLDIDI